MYLVQSTEHNCPGCFLAHDERRGAPLALSVIDKRCYRRTILCPRKAVRMAPILQRICSWAFAGFDFSDDFDRRGNARTGSHLVPAKELERMGIAKTNHIKKAMIRPQKRLAQEPLIV